MIVDITEADLDSGVEFTDVESSQIERVAWVNAEMATMLGWNALDPIGGGYWSEGDQERPPDDPFLVVEFKTKKDRSIYVYRGASSEDFELMVDPDGSAGRYLHAAVKPEYPFLKLRLVESYGADDETPA